MTRDELAEIWTIDRSEEIEVTYRVTEGGLVPRPEHFQVHGWEPEEVDRYREHLAACFDRGGTFLGAFDGARLVGVAVLDTVRRGPARDSLQLSFLHVSRSDRGQGVGARLFEEMRALARVRGARYLYVSATPSEKTVRFYQRRGCVLAPEPDPELFALEPDDVHFLCPVEVSRSP